MQALFIGQTYIDVTFLADALPTGDEKAVAQDYAISFGGNAVTAAFCCAKLGLPPDLLTSVADDWLGRMFIDMAAKYGISVHHRKVHGEVRRAVRERHTFHQGGVGIEHRGRDGCVVLLHALFELRQ